MDLRHQVKQVLRIFGHALVITVHDRLDGIEYMLRSILEQNTHLASTQTALLQSGVYLVENLDHAWKELAETQAHVSEIQKGVMETRVHVSEIHNDLHLLRETCAANAE